MTVLRLDYRGEGAFRPGLPARDLDRADLEALSATSKRDIADIVLEAVGSGLYTAVEVDDQGDVELEAPVDEVSARKDPIEDPATTRPALVEMAATLGIEVASRDTKKDITAAILAERQRLADAATDAAGSGEGNPGGEGTPADDPDASATGEAGSPPDEGAPA